MSGVTANRQVSGKKSGFRPFFDEFTYIVLYKCGLLGWFLHGYSNPWRRKIAPIRVIKDGHPHTFPSSWRRKVANGVGKQSNFEVGLGGGRKMEIIGRSGTSRRTAATELARIEVDTQNPTV